MLGKEVSFTAFPTAILRIVAYVHCVINDLLCVMYINIHLQRC